MGGIAALISKGDVSDAAEAQSDAAREAAQLQMEMFQMSRKDAEPWRKAGMDALTKLMGGEIKSPTRTEKRLTG